MKILVIMSDNRKLCKTLDGADYNSLTACLNYSYCKAQGYDFTYYQPFLDHKDDGNMNNCIDPNDGSPRYPAWAKILSMQKALSLPYDYIVYTDSDCIFKDTDQRIEETLINMCPATSDIIAIGSRPYSIELPCSGFFICRNTDTSKRFIQDVYNQYIPQHNLCHEWEQSAFRAIYKDYGVFVLDQVWFGEQDGQFLRHVDSSTRKGDNHSCRINYFTQEILKHDIDYSAVIEEILNDHYCAYKTTPTITDLLSAPAFVVHLPRSTERLPFFTKNIADAGFTDMRIFEGVDGRDPGSRADALVLFNNPPIDGEPSYGQIGCLFSHLKVLKHIVDNKIPIATVFEDDAHFHPEWKTLSEAYWEKTPKYFDILFIGNGLDSMRSRTDSTGISEITTESAWCTHAYVVTCVGAKKVLDSILSWDYRKFHHATRGKTLSGLYPIDIMLKDIENNVLNGSIPKQFVWYSWNGTKYPCQFNKLPIVGNDARNTGLVFQNADNFKSLVAEHGYVETENFYTESGEVLNTNEYETTEQWIADTFISPDATVLELGGRLGVVSTHISKRLTDTRRHFVVEPDPAVFRQMYRNLLFHNCNPHVFNGVISKKPLYFQQEGLASRTRESACSCDSFIVPHKSLAQIMEETGLKFDTLVADCEGCLEGFIDDNIGYLDNFKMITYEEDYANECDYEKIKRIFAEHHFVCIRPGGHSVWERQPPLPPPPPPPPPPPTAAPTPQTVRARTKVFSFLRTR